MKGEDRTAASSAVLERLDRCVAECQSLGRSVWHQDAPANLHPGGCLLRFALLRHARKPAVRCRVARPPIVPAEPGEEGFPCFEYPCRLVSARSPGLAVLPRDYSFGQSALCC